MVLADKLATPPPRNASRCSVAVLLSSLPDSEAKALNTMLDGNLWTHKAIVQALADEGYTIGNRSIERHRQGVCKCPRD